MTLHQYVLAFTMKSTLPFTNLFKMLFATLYIKTRFEAADDNTWLQYEADKATNCFHAKGLFYPPL